MKIGTFLAYIHENEIECSLLLGDVNQIHSFVFETSKLPEIRGASQILDTLITKGFKELFDSYFTDVSSMEKIDENTANAGYIIYNNAGNCMALIPTGEIEKFVNALSEKFHQETGIVTITTVHSPLLDLTSQKVHSVAGGEISKWILDSNKDQLKGFMILLKFLHYRLKIEKEKKSHFPFLESNPIARRCDSCRKRPAVHKSTIDNETSYICDICNKKRIKGKKSVMIEKLAEKDSFYNKYIGKSPPDLDNLAGASSYLGILYADGNDMSNLLYNTKDLNEFKDKSEKIEEAIFESLDHLLREFEKCNQLPFEILNMAGDDILLILRAENILEFSLKLLSNFERTCSQKLDENITMSAGITIFKARYPIQYAFEITKSLLKESKRFAKQYSKAQSAISYLYMKTPIATFSSHEILDSYYRISDKICLTMRPYTRDQFELLLEMADEIKKKQILTNTQMNLISRTFEGKSIYSTVNFIKYQIARMDNSNRELLTTMIGELKDKFNLEDLDGTTGLPLWRKRIINGKCVNSTPLLDILEIIEITGGDSFEQSVD